VSNQDKNKRTVKLYGEVKSIDEIQNHKNIRFQKFVLRTIEDYPQDFEIEAVNEQVEYSSMLAPGVLVEVWAVVKGKVARGNQRKTVSFVDLQSYFISMG